MDMVLSGLTEVLHGIFDDVVAFSDSWTGHLRELGHVFERLEQAGNSEFQKV
jgi:hypothetical protein